METKFSIIAPLGAHGGMHYYNHDLANALRDCGAEVIMFAPINHLEPKNYVHNVEFDEVYSTSKKSNILRAFLLTFGYFRSVFISKISNSNNIINHIFKSDIFESILLCMISLFMMKSISIVHDIDRLDRVSKFSFKKFIFFMSSKIVVHNEFCYKALVSQFPAFEQKIFIIPHGNYVGQFRDLPSSFHSREKLKLPPQENILLFFGNPREEKGLDILIDALSIIPERMDVHLVIAGKMKPKEELQLRAKILERKLGSRVTPRIGHVPDDMVADYYRAASLVVLPYKRVYESGVAIMAMSLGRPVLASDLAVFQALVQEGAPTIHLFKSEEPGALADGIVETLAHYAGREALGEFGRTFVMERRSWAASALKYKSLFC